jgi:hypothetical protein
MFYFAVWDVTQASYLSRQKNIFAYLGTSGRESLRDNSGWNSNLLCG